MGKMPLISFILVVFLFAGPIGLRGECPSIPLEPDHLALSGIVEEVIPQEGQIYRVKVKVLSESCRGEKDFLFCSPEGKPPAVGNRITFSINKNTCSSSGEPPYILEIRGLGE